MASRLRKRHRFNQCPEKGGDERGRARACCQFVLSGSTPPSKSPLSSCLYHRCCFCAFSRPTDPGDLPGLLSVSPTGLFLSLVSNQGIQIETSLHTLVQKKQKEVIRSESKGHHNREAEGAGLANCWDTTAVTSGVIHHHLQRRCLGAPANPHLSVHSYF